MDYPPTSEITHLLRSWSDGDASALKRLAPLVSDDLRRIAEQQLRKEPRDHTPQSTSLINEAFLRLMGQHELRWESREAFFGDAARLMRRILAEYARRRRSDQRGAALVRVDLTENHQATGGYSLEFLALDQALDDLAAMDPELAHLFELRFFGGLEVDDIAKLLGVSTTTVEREWASARAWLWRKLTEG